MNHKFSYMALLLLVILALPSLSSAHPQDAASLERSRALPSPVAVSAELTWLTVAGKTLDNKATPGAGLGGMVLARTHAHSAGVLLEGELLGWRGRATHLGVIAGVGHEPSSAYRMEVMLEGGGSHYSGVGGDLFSSVVAGGESKWLPYVGGRFGYSRRFGRRQSYRFGLWVGVRGDLQTQRVSSTLHSCFIGCTVQKSETTVGGMTGYVAARIGFGP